MLLQLRATPRIGLIKFQSTSTCNLRIFLTSTSNARKTARPFSTSTLLFASSPDNQHKHDHSHTTSDLHSHSYSHETTVHDHSHSVFGHSHTHSSADSVFLKEKGGLRNPAIRITWIGLFVNLSMAVGKGIGGVVFHSQALLADSIHALSDLVSDFLTLATVSVANSKPSKLFPNGYGKIETLGSLGVSALLLLAGVSVGWSGLISLIQQVWGDTQWIQALTGFFGHGHSHSHGGGEAGHGHEADSIAQTVDINAMWLALGSIAVKEWLFRSTMKVAERTGSTVLVANAWHHRVDSLTSIVAVCTIGGSYFMGLSWLDAFGGLLVSSVIIRAGFKNGQSAVLELADNTRNVSTDLIEAQRTEIQRILNQNAIMSHGTIMACDLQLNQLTVLPSGPNVVSRVQLKLNKPDLSASQLVATTGFVEQELSKSSDKIKAVLVTVVGTEKSQDKEMKNDSV